MDERPDNADEAGAGEKQSFADFFAEAIAPGLPAMEEARKERLRATYVRAVGLAFVIALITGIAVAWSGEVILGFPVVFVGLLLGYLWIRIPGRRHREAVRSLVVEPLRRYLGGLEYHRKPGDRFDLGRFQRSGIVAGFDKAKLEDLLIGRYRDTDYRVVEARLRRRRKRGSKERLRMTFAGLLCEVSVPRAFSCTVILLEDKGALGNWAIDLLRSRLTNLSPVPLDHTDFEARYQVYSDDPEEARGLLQPAFLDSLLAIADAAGQGALNCAFIDSRFLIAIPQRRNLFEIGRLHRSLEHAEEDVRRMAAEFTLPQRLIDTLHGERPRLTL
ncbi:DUF3137 domain-containing protein [Pelagibius sp.]|uniref:DUF3137 domain-containing protein n=1 Tax=Pelagibius sp. TaxID=1931238 RepID=UPI003B5074D4